MTAEVCRVSLVTTPLAAQAVAVAPSTVRWWRHKGWLHPVTTINGQPVYYRADVLRLERDTRARRTRPA